MRGARKQYRSRPSKRGFLGAFKKGGGGILDLVSMSLGKGQLYGGVARKFFPQLAPIAQLYGEYSGGGLEGLGINELFVNGFLGLPQALPNVLGSGGLLGNLLGGGSGSSMQSGMGAMV